MVRTVAAFENDLVIDWCPVSRISELQAFIDKHWKSDHILARDRNLLVWQYRFVERPDFISVLIATRGDELVGFLGVIRIQFNQLGFRRAAGWLATWYVLPSERERRSGMALLRTAFCQGFSMIGCLGMNAVTRQILAALRFNIQDPIPRWILPTTSAAFASLMSGRPAPAPERTPAAGDWNGSIEVTAWSEDAAVKWDEVWLKLSKQFISVWRDSEYLRWRYVEHPLFAYTVKFAKERTTGELLGVMVYRIETIQDRTEKVLRLVEFLAERNGGNALAADVSKAVERHGVAFADFYCTSADIAGPLEAVGFQREQPGVPVLPALFQPLEWQPRALNGAFWEESGDGTLFREPRVYFTRADGDQDRPN